MGWLFKHNFSRAMLVEHLTKPYDGEETSNRTIAHCLRGNVLWSVLEITAKVDGLKMDESVLSVGQSKRFIACNLLARESGCGWGYKDMIERMHPFYYTCPLIYLEMVPVACREWREKVYEYHGKPPQMAGLRMPEIMSNDAPIASLNQLSLI